MEDVKQVVRKGLGFIRNNVGKSSEAYKELESELDEIKRELNDLKKSKKIKEDLPEDEIIYLTGMSINKKLVQKVYSHISTDKDYDVFLKNIDVLFSTYKPNFASSSEYNKRIESFKKIENTVGTNIQNIMDNSVNWTISYFLIITASITNIEELKFLFTLLAGLSNILSFGSNTYEFLRIEEHQIRYGKNKNNSLDKNSIFIPNELINEVLLDKQDRIKCLDWSNFFAIYQSNQSDSRGVSSLASGDNEDVFSFSYGYADSPFYSNLFINNVTVELSPCFVKKYLENTDYKTFFSAVYLQHGVDILLSRLLSEYMDEYSDKAKNNTTYSFNKLNHLNSFLQNSETETIKQLAASFKERNLFGIDLLSRVFAGLIELKNNFKNVDEVKMDKVVVYIANIDDKKKLFLHEIFEYASSPTLFEVSDKKENADIFLNMNYWEGNGIIGDDRFEKKQSEISGKNVSITNHFFYKEKNIISVPIKIFVSIPETMRISENKKKEKFIVQDFSDYLKEENKIFKVEKPLDRQLLVPERLMHDTKDNGHMIVLTVGGVEHNRPLLHLINKHRQEYQNKRQLGIFDNVFDFAHRQKYHTEDGYENYFIAGVNQPVSGYNAVLTQRLDDRVDGNSVSTTAKLIYFQLEGYGKDIDEYGNREIIDFHVISIYGFSALASAFATLYMVYQLKDAFAKSKKSKDDLNPAHEAMELKYSQSVFTQRLIFKPNDYIEHRLAEISNGLEYLSYVRLDELNTTNKNAMKNFITSVQSQEKNSFDNPKSALWKKLDGKITTKDPLLKSKQGKT